MAEYKKDKELEEAAANTAEGLGAAKKKATILRKARNEYKVPSEAADTLEKMLSRKLGNNPDKPNMSTHEDRMKKTYSAPADSKSMDRPARYDGSDVMKKKQVKEYDEYVKKTSPVYKANEKKYKK